MKHINLLDIIALAYCTGRQLNTLQKIELAKIPLIGEYLMDIGGIPIDRTDSFSKTTANAFRYTVWLLNQGEVVCYFPEMTRASGYVAKVHPDLITHYRRRVRDIPTLCVGVSYEHDKAWYLPKNKVDVRIEEADLSGDSLEEISDSLGHQMARLSGLEYLPGLSKKYLDKSVATHNNNQGD
jgi:1-acyl-sn-glycerol-3-phosphate acyltransferase